MNSDVGCRTRPLSRDEVRALDARALEELGLPGLLLMENAGRGATEFLFDLMAGGPTADARAGSVREQRVLVLCGPGNNGGDGGVVARHLDGRGVATRVVWFAKSAGLKGDAAFQWSVLKRAGVDQSAWFDDRPDDVADADEAESKALDALMADADWLVDGLLGTGLARPVTGRIRAVIEAINRSGKPVLALDVPSGLDADSGAPLGGSETPTSEASGIAVIARATATFAAPKLGFSAPGAERYTGLVEVIDIGLPRRLLAPFWNDGR